MGIEDVLEQEAIADTLVAPLQPQYAQEPEPEYSDDAEQAVAEPRQRSEFWGGGQDEPEPTEATDELEATPEQREQYAQEMTAWQEMPEQEKAQLAHDYLETQYEAAYGNITPAEAASFTDAIGENWGIQNLSSKIDPVPFSVFAETWSDHAQRTVALHPEGQQFLEAVANDPERAVHVALSMCDPVMSQRFFEHFQNLLGPQLFQGRSPMQLAAECLVDLAQLEGWGAPRQEQGESSVGRNSPFQTNQDIFDNQAVSVFRGI
jgi:hypothetical protein